jgi:hypothetical protein
MILKGSEEANTLKKEHIKQARRALEACKSWRTKTSKDARNNRIRCLEVAVASTWLAVGVDRYEESYNSHGVRV